MKSQVSMISDKKILGPEPELSGQVDRMSLVNALNWYNYFYTSEQSKQWLLTYMADVGYTKQQIADVDSLHHKQVPQSICSVARLLTKGAVFDHKLDQQIQQLLNLARANVKATSKLPEINCVIANIDDLIDQMIENNYRPVTYSIDQLVAGGKATDVAKAIIYCKQLASEIVGDPEGYDHLTSAQAKRYSTFVATIASELGGKAPRKSKTRRARKSKVKSAVVVASKMNYLGYDPILQLRSIDPSTIVGATVVWTYHTKNRKLTKYLCKPGQQISINRSTIVGYCETKSASKKVRRPAITVSKIVEQAKAAASETFDKIKGKSTSPTGRINKFTILLRAIK